MQGRAVDIGDGNAEISIAEFKKWEDALYEDISDNIKWFTQKTDINLNMFVGDVNKGFGIIDNNNPSMMLRERVRIKLISTTDEDDIWSEKIYCVSQIIRWEGDDFIVEPYDFDGFHTRLPLEDIPSVVHFHFFHKLPSGTPIYQEYLLAGINKQTAIG